MLTEKELEAVKNSESVDVTEVLYGKFKLEDMEDYFKREMKENLLEQGWELPKWLEDPDDDTPPVPEYLKEKPDPDPRSRYDGIYDGNQEEEPHYGSRIYWQWLAVTKGRINYVRGYDLEGNQVCIQRGMYGKVLIAIRDHLMGTASNPIIHKGYSLFKVKREDLVLEGMEEVEFFTCYLF